MSRMNTNIFYFIIIGFLHISITSCNNNSNMNNTEIDNEMEIDTIIKTEPFDSTYQELLTNELKGLYEGAYYVNNSYNQPTPKFLIDSILVLEKGSPRTYQINKIALDRIQNFIGKSNSIEDDTLWYSRRISTYQGEGLVIIRSQKVIWTESAYSHNVPMGSQYYTGYYRRK